MQIFTEALVKKVEQAEDIYTAQAINAYTHERGPFDFSLEAELTNVVSVEDILEFKPCPPFVPEVIDDLQREQRANLHMHHGSFGGDGFIPPEGFNVNPGTPYTQRPLNDDELQKLREDVQDANDGKPIKVVTLGTPRIQVEHLIATCKDTGIEIAQRSTYDESDLIGDIDMKMLSTTALSLKHLNASPYQGGRRPREETELNTNRKLVRKAQSSLNKKQGFGKRLTKKDKLEAQTKSNYVETYVLERTDIIEIDRGTGKTKVINNE